MNEPWLNRLMADIAAGKGLWQQSLDHLEMAMAQEDPSLQDFMTASELSILAGNKEGAVDYCRRAVVLEPGPVSYGGLGEAFFAVEEIDSALVYLRLAVEQAPEDTQLSFQPGQRPGGVRSWSKRPISISRPSWHMVPDDPVGHFNYGIHLDKLGRSEEALAEVTRAIELNPRMLTARVVQAQILEDLGRWDEALEVVAGLNEIDEANTAELTAWEDRIIAAAGRFAGRQSAKARSTCCTWSWATAKSWRSVAAELAAGTPFTAWRCSSPPVARPAKGGDIGWINPAGHGGTHEVGHPGAGGQRNKPSGRSRRAVSYFQEDSLEPLAGDIYPG